MSADLLREAAAQIREDFQAFECNACGVPEPYMVAVADWLDSEDTHQFGPTEHAIKVARAYLGRDA